MFAAGYIWAESVGSVINNGKIYPPKATMIDMVATINNKGSIDAGQDVTLRGNIGITSSDLISAGISEDGKVGAFMTPVVGQ